MTQYSNGGGTTTALPTLAEYVEETRRLARVYRDTDSLLGVISIDFVDKLIDGPKLYGRDVFVIKEICESEKLTQKLGTIHKYITVMRKFPKETRPRDPNNALSISHYSAVVYSGCTKEQQIELLQEYADISLENGGDGLYHETDSGNSITEATVEALAQKANLQGGGTNIAREHYPAVKENELITAALKAGGQIDLPVFENGYSYELKQTLVRRKKAE